MQEEEISQEEYEIFAGEQAEYYLNAWEKKISFNWAAFTFSIFWMLYRKMYLSGLLFLCSMMIFSLLTEGLLLALRLPEESYNWALLSLLLLVHLLLGFTGNRLYLYEVRQRIRYIRQFELEEDEYYQKVSDEGGTTLMPFIFIASIILIMLLMGYSL